MAKEPKKKQFNFNNCICYFFIWVLNLFFQFVKVYLFNQFYIKRYYGLWMWFPVIFNKMEKYGGTVCSVKSGNQSADNETDKFCDDINPNIYWEGLIVASSNLPGNIFTIFFIEKLGRRWLLCKFEFLYIKL